MDEFNKVRLLAEKYLDENFGKGWIILHEHTKVFECGWVFFFKMEEYLTTGDSRLNYGPGPFLIDRINKNYFYLGNPFTWEKNLEEYITNEYKNSHLHHG